MKLLMCCTSLLSIMAVAFSAPLQGAYNTTHSKERIVTGDFKDPGNTTDHPKTTPAYSSPATMEPEPEMSSVAETLDSEARSERTNSQFAGLPERYSLSRGNTSGEKYVAAPKLPAEIQVNQDSQETEVLSEVHKPKKQPGEMTRVPDRVRTTADHGETPRVVPGERDMTARETASRRRAVTSMLDPGRAQQDFDSLEAVNGRPADGGYSRDRDLDETREYISAERNPTAALG